MHFEFRRDGLARPGVSATRPPALHRPSGTPIPAQLKCHSVGGGTNAAAFHVRASAVERSAVNHARDANLRKVARTAAPRANEWKSLYGALDYQLRQRRPNSARSRGVFAREGK